MKANKYLFLFLICILFLFTRLYKIADIPGSVYWDEASIGYNAYSVGLDGKDEWGSFLPIHFRAFGEFKLPVYIYSVVPFVKLFGLNAFSVRIPSVLYSLLVLLFTYLLTKNISKSETISIFSIFFITVTPWLFIFSRTGYEATAGLAFFLGGLYIYFKSLDSPKWFFVTTAFFIASMYSYNSFRIFSLLTLIPLTIFFLWNYRKNIKKTIPILIFSFLVLMASLAPIVRLYKYDTGGQRITSVGLSGSNSEKIQKFLTNYFSHYSPKFLFIYGDSNLRSQMSGFGELYWASFPLIVLGALYIIKKKKNSFFLIIFLLLISPIPAAITKESPHSLRSILALPCYAMIASLGVQYLIVTYKKYSALFLSSIVIVFLLSFELYLTKFFTVYPSVSSKDWQYEYKDIVENHKYIKNGFGKYVITDEYGQPYIFVLFYLKYNPEDFRKTVKYNPVDRWGFSTVESFDSFIFKK